MSYEQQVWNAWTAGIVFLIVVVTYFVLSHRSEDHGPTLLARLFIMLREWQETRRAASMQPVYIPVSSMPYQTGGMEKDEADAPDIDAVDAGMPHFDRDITDGEWIVRMACARGADKKYRFSANQIHAAVGGDRNAVLAKVKELRAGVPPPEFMQPDGTRVQATYPVTGRRTHA